MSEDDYVSRSFCDERFARILAEQKAAIKPLKQSVDYIKKKQVELLEVMKSIEETFRNAGNRSERSPKEKWLFYGTVITTFGLLLKTVIEIIAKAMGVG